MQSRIYKIVSFSLLITSCISPSTSQEDRHLRLMMDTNSARLDTNQTLERLAFGSCNDQQKAAAPWKTIAEQKPQLWIWLGDTVYGEKPSALSLQMAYKQQLELPAYQTFKENTAIIGIWDDHDYAYNNAGKEVAFKKTSQQLFLDFLQEPESSARRRQEGIYTSYEIGAKDKQVVKIILLDTRYHADHQNPNTDLLGKAQWEWLTELLTHSKAKFHIIASGIQVLPNEHRFEKWSNFPRARARLLQLFKKTRPSGLILLSGDRHIAEISRISNKEDVVTEITSSGLTHSYSSFVEEANKYRLGNVFSEKNFGLISFDWNVKPALATVSVLDENGKTKLEVNVTASGDR